MRISFRTRPSSGPRSIESTISSSRSFSASAFEAPRVVRGLSVRHGVAEREAEEVSAQDPEHRRRIRRQLLVPPRRGVERVDVLPPAAKRAVRCPPSAVTATRTPAVPRVQLGWPLIVARSPTVPLLPCPHRGQEGRVRLLAARLREDVVAGGEDVPAARRHDVDRLCDLVADLSDREGREALDVDPPSPERDVLPEIPLQPGETHPGRAGLGPGSARRHRPPPGPG